MDGMLVAACAAAALSGTCLAVSWVGSRQEMRRLKSVRESAGARDRVLVHPECGGLAQRVLEAAQRESRVARSARMGRVLESAALSPGLRDAPVLLARAGLAGAASPQGLRAVRLKATLAGFPAGALAGAVLSPELSALLALAAAAAGYACVPRSLKREAAVRNAQMERHLSEMIEVVVLGLRSGLSFERSFSLYPRYFDTGLGRAMSRAAGRWETGLQTREEALRRLEAEYDSALLSRVVGSMVRSLRFGTSVADSLEASAAEAREVHRARMEEQVAKVAVKMMLPVGTLILPAMLLLVLGPVLLELAQGF